MGKLDKIIVALVIFALGVAIGAVSEYNDNINIKNKATQSAPVRERAEVLADKINILKQNGYTPEQAIHIAMVEANLKPVDDKYISYITQ